MRNDQPSQAPTWDAIARNPAFASLLSAKARFLWPACAFFVMYYFALPILVGWAPELMKRQVIGPVNLAYLFALSQFFMAWTIAFLYIRRASAWDRQAAEVLQADSTSANGRTQGDA